MTPERRQELLDRINSTTPFCPEALVEAIKDRAELFIELEQRKWNSEELAADLDAVVMALKRYRETLEMIIHDWRWLTSDDERWLRERHPELFGNDPQDD